MAGGDLADEIDHPDKEQLRNFRGLYMQVLLDKLEDWMLTPTGLAYLADLFNRHSISTDQIWYYSPEESRLDYHISVTPKGETSDGTF